MNQIFAQMYADASARGEAAKGAMNTAATPPRRSPSGWRPCARGRRKRSAWHRGGPQRAGALKSRLGEVDRPSAKPIQGVNDATAKMAEAYKGPDQHRRGQPAAADRAVKARYQQEQSALEPNPVRGRADHQVDAAADRGADAANHAASGRPRPTTPC